MNRLILILLYKCTCHFFLFSYWVFLARTFSSMWNRSSNSGCPGFVPHLRGKVFSLSSQSMMVGASFSHVVFITFSLSPPITSLLSVSFSKRYLILSKSFAASTDMIMQFLIFLLLLWVNTLIDFHIQNHPYIRYKSNLVMMYNPFSMLLIVCQYLFIILILIIFWSKFITDISHLFSLSGSYVRVMLTSQNEFGGVSSFF